MENSGTKSLLRIGEFQDAVFVGLCSAGLLAYSLYHHRFDRNTSEWKMSPYLFPTLISVFGFLLAISLLADALHELRGGREGAAAAGKKNPVGVLVLVGASFLYYLLMPVIHFIPATILYLLGLFLYLGERKWWKLALLSLITTFAVYARFGLGLNVRLP